jgi:phage tail protein X
MDTPDADLDHDCPRCGRAVTTRFYGPCPACVEALAEAYPGLARDVQAPEYEPKMNVVPNQIATKD